MSDPGKAFYSPSVAVVAEKVASLSV